MSYDCKVTFEWTCDVCGKKEQTFDVADSWMDVMAQPPKTWGYPKDDDTFACEACVQKELLHLGTQGLKT